MRSNPILWVINAEFTNLYLQLYFDNVEQLNKSLISSEKLTLCQSAISVEILWWWDMLPYQRIHMYICNSVEEDVLPQSRSALHQTCRGSFPCSFSWEFTFQSIELGTESCIIRPKTHWQGISDWLRETAEKQLCISVGRPGAVFTKHVILPLRVVSKSSKSS